MERLLTSWHICNRQIKFCKTVFLHLFCVHTRGDGWSVQVFKPIVNELYYYLVKGKPWLRVPPEKGFRGLGRRTPSCDPQGTLIAPKFLKPVSTKTCRTENNFPLTLQFSPDKQKTETNPISKLLLGHHRVSGRGRRLAVHLLLGHYHLLLLTCSLLNRVMVV